MNKQKLRKKSTTVSKSDKVNVEEVFSMLDFDQDGFLSGNDIVQAVWAAGVPSSPEEIAKAVASLK
jgi:Ca2+-binding EF-hand superfamily protein